MVLVSILGVADPATAQTEPDTAAAPDSVEQELVEKWAPIYLLKSQDEPCDDQGEQYEPASVDIVLDNPEIALRLVSPGDPVALFGPGGADLYGLGEGYYLEYPGLTLSPGCVYEQDFRRYQDGANAVVYAHIVQEPGHADQLAVQYWTFWYFNDWNNKHETDWEFTQLLFEASTVEEALATGPVRVGYAQHEGGEKADWDDAKLEKIDGRPVVYPSTGSHASYFSSALYLGRSGSEGFGCDNTDGPSREVRPDVVLLPDQPTGPDDPFAWLAFEGRWGERHSGAFNGPTGPAAKERWSEPVSWFGDLRSSSVIIPAGDSFGSAVLTTFCAVVETGSGLLIRYLNSPAVVFIGLIVLGWAALALGRRTEWSPREPLPIRTPRRAGQILGSAAAMYRRRRGTFIMIGLAYVPMSLLTGAAIALLSRIAGFAALIDLIGDDDVLGGLLVLTITGLASMLVFVFVQAAAAHVMQGEEQGVTVGAAEAYRAVFARLRPLAGGMLRATLYVAFWAATVVGAPVAVWLLIRYQFLGQTVMLEDRDGREGLRLSGSVVDGRWVHTAFLVAFIDLTVVAVAFSVGLLMLVLIAGLPLWAFNILTSAVLAVLVPLAAIANTLIYGDRVATAASQAESPPASENTTAEV